MGMVRASENNVLIKIFKKNQKNNGPKKWTGSTMHILFKGQPYMSPSLLLKGSRQIPTGPDKSRQVQTIPNNSSQVPTRLDRFRLAQIGSDSGRGRAHNQLKSLRPVPPTITGPWSMAPTIKKASPRRRPLCFGRLDDL